MSKGIFQHALYNSSLTKISWVRIGMRLNVTSFKTCDLQSYKEPHSLKQSAFKCHSKIYVLQSCKELRSFKSVLIQMSRILKRVFFNLELFFLKKRSLAWSV